jgi:hypothetical protein
MNFFSSDYSNIITLLWVIPYFNNGILTPTCNKANKGFLLPGLIYMFTLISITTLIIVLFR